MNIQMNTKVRRVRCPRCLGVLLEPAEVPVYKCGGCDTILKAKNRKKYSQGTGVRVHEADPTQKNDLENISEDEKATILSTCQSDSDKISERGESGMDCKREWLGGGNQSDESPCSDAISCHENASSSPEARAQMEAKEDKFPSEQCGSNESRDDGREHSGGISVSNEISSSSEFNCHQNESSVPGSQTYENESLLSSSRKVAESRYSSENSSDGDTNESENCDLELPLNTSFSKEVSSSDLCTSLEIEGPSQLAGVDREVDENMKNHSIYRSWSVETSLYMTPTNQISAAQSSSTESVSADNQSDESPCSDAISCHKNASSSPEAIAQMEAKEDKFPSEQCGSNESRDDGREHSGGISVSNEISSSSELNCHENESSVPVSQTYENESSLSSSRKVAESRYSSENNSDGDTNESENCDLELPLNTSFSKEVSSSDLCTSLEIEDPSQLAGVDREVDENMKSHSIYKSWSVETSLYMTPTDQISAAQSSLTESVSADNQSDESPCSDAISCHKNASSSPEARAQMEAKEDKFPSEQCGSNESRDDGREHSGGISVSNEISSSSEFNCHENESSVPGSQTYENELLLSSSRKVAESRYSSENNSDGDTNESEHCDLELPLNTSFSKEVSSSDLCTSLEIEDPSQLAGVDREVDENMKSNSIYRSWSVETSLYMTPTDQISAAQSSSTESVSADNLTSPCTESKKEAQNGIISGFQRLSSVDTLESIPHVYSRSDLGVTLRSPTAKNYYAYDAGASSSNETNDQVANRRFHPLKRNFKDAHSSSAKRLPKRAGFMVNHAMSSESELQHRPMNSSSILPGKKHPASKERKWHQGEFLEPARYRLPVRSMMRMETNGYQSGMPFYSNGSQAGCRNGSFSSYGQTNLSEMPGNPPEADKLELLRMVYELQDQLKRTQISKGVPHGRFSTRVAKKEEHISSYNEHFAPEREIYPNPNCHRNPGRYSQDVTWFQQGNQVSRMAPLSGHTAHRWHQVNCLCLRCRRQERYYSAQLPPHIVGCNKGYSMADPIQNYYRPYHSASSSPQHYYTPSEFSLWSRDTKSDDQMHNDHEVKKKHWTAKQHLLPIAGGAPIVACYRCSEMLQLPADFLLFKKRCHRLRCNACSRVLKFSLEMKRDLASASRASDCPHGEPVSYSDDYGQSFCRSCSTEGDNFPLIRPFETANRISDSKKMSSSISLESKKEGKKKSIIMEEFPNKYKNHVKRFDAAWPSSEIEELSPSSSSQLHRLMGYSSPSRLIYKYSDYSTVEQD